MDDGVYRPYSEYFEIDSGKVLKRMSGSWKDTIQDLVIREDSLLFPYRSYDRASVRRFDDILTMGKHYPLIYKKVVPNDIGLDSAQIKDRFLLGQWESASKFLTFSEKIFPEK